jgi:hypothetical protein
MRIGSYRSELLSAQSPQALLLAEIAERKETVPDQGNTGATQPAEIGRTSEPSKGLESA